MSTAPNMAAITAALERSLQNCSLTQQQHRRETTAMADSHGGIGNSSASSSNEISHQQNPNVSLNSDTALELNSHISLPYHWEQCLDLKTGEIYYINWRNGMKAKEDPRSTTEYSQDYNNYSEEEEEEDDDDDTSSYDSEESSTESSAFINSSREHHHHHHQQQHQHHHQHHQINSNKVYHQREEDEEEVEKKDHVLVVAGCKSCLMYFMVPKHLEDCPKCTGQLLHFDRSDNDIP